MATDFHCFLGYISHLINLLQMKVKVKCLFNLRFCLGMHLFFWRHTMFSSSISLSPDLKQRQQGRKVEEAECHSSSWLGKRNVCLPHVSSQAFMKWGGTVQFEAGDSEQFQALVEESDFLLFPHPLVLHCSLKGANCTLLCCSYSVAWLIRAFQKKI